MRKALQWLKGFDGKDVATLWGLVLVAGGTAGLEGWAIACIVVGALILMGLVGLILLGEIRRNGTYRQHPEQ